MNLLCTNEIPDVDAAFLCKEVDAIAVTNSTAVRVRIAGLITSPADEDPGWKLHHTGKFWFVTRDVYEGRKAQRVRDHVSAAL